MTLAPRVEVFTQLACDLVTPAHNATSSHSFLVPQTPYEQCLQDPIVQAKASKLQTGMSLVTPMTIALNLSCNSSNNDHGCSFCNHDRMVGSVRRAARPLNRSLFLNNWFTRNVSRSPFLSFPP
jgi:hypothetical protein